MKVGDKGRPKGIWRKLLPHEEQQVRQDITDKCPEQLKLAFALWTRQAVCIDKAELLGGPNPAGSREISETLGIFSSKTDSACL